MFINLSLKSQDFEKGMKKAQQDISSLDKHVTQFGKNLAGLGVIAIAAFAGWGLTSLISNLKNLVEASNRQQEAVLGMETAMKSMGRYTPEMSKQLQKYAQQLQKVTNYGDEATMQGVKFLMTYKGITDNLMPRSIKTMQDLAALMGGGPGGLTRAANMLGKASMGMTGELRRVGITVDSATYKAEGYSGVLAQIEEQTKGQAEAMRQADQGYTAIKNSVGDLHEKLGDLIKIQLGDFFNDSANALDNLNESLQKNIDLAKQMRDEGYYIIGTPESPEPTFVQGRYQGGQYQPFEGAGMSAEELAAARLRMAQEEAAKYRKIWEESYAKLDEIQQAVAAHFRSEWERAYKDSGIALDKFVAAKIKNLKKVITEEAKEVQRLAGKAGEIAVSFWVADEKDLQDAHDVSERFFISKREEWKKFLEERSKKEAERTSEIWEEQYTKQIENQKKIYENFLKNVQTWTADTFYQIFTTGLDDWKDYFDQIYKYFLRLLSEMVAAAAMNKIVIPITSNLTGGAISGAGSNLLAGLFGAGTTSSLTGTSAEGAAVADMWVAGGSTATLGMSPLFAALPVAIPLIAGMIMKSQPSKPWHESAGRNFRDILQWGLAGGATSNFSPDVWTGTGAELSDWFTTQLAESPLSPYAGSETALSNAVTQFNRIFTPLIADIEDGTEAFNVLWAAIQAWKDGNEEAIDVVWSFADMLSDAETWADPAIWDLFSTEAQGTMQDFTDFLSDPENWTTENIDATSEAFQAFLANIGNLTSSWEDLQYQWQLSDPTLSALEKAILQTNREFDNLITQFTLMGASEEILTDIEEHREEAIQRLYNAEYKQYLLEQKQIQQALDRERHQGYQTAAGIASGLQSDINQYTMSPYEYAVWQAGEKKRATYFSIMALRSQGVSDETLTAMMHQADQLYDLEIEAAQSLLDAAETQEEAADIIERAADAQARSADEIERTYSNIWREWSNIVESIQTQISTMLYSRSNPYDALQRLSGIQNKIYWATGGGMNVADYLNALGSSQRAGAVTNLMDLYGTYLSTAQEAYQRPSIEYQVIFKQIQTALAQLEGYAQYALSDTEIALQQLGILEQIRDGIYDLGDLGTVGGGTGGTGSPSSIASNIASNWGMSLTSLKMYDIPTNYQAWKGWNLSQQQNLVWDVMGLPGYNISQFGGEFAWLAANWGSYQHGIDYVPRTGPYILHEGERVSNGDDVQMNMNFYITGGSGGSIKDQVIAALRSAPGRAEIQRISKGR